MILMRGHFMDPLKVFFIMTLVSSIHVTVLNLSGTTIFDENYSEDTKVYAIACDVFIKNYGETIANSNAFFCYFHLAGTRVVKGSETLGDCYRELSSQKGKLNLTLIKRDSESVDAFLEISQNGFALKKYSDLQSDEEAVQIAIEQSAFSLQFASIDCRDKPEIVRKAVKKSGMALQFATIGCRKDKAVVQEAVEENGFALQFASPECRGDPEIVRKAVKQNRFAIGYAIENFKESDDTP